MRCLGGKIWMEITYEIVHAWKEKFEGRLLNDLTEKNKKVSNL